jgi:nucleoside-diphosphate-sugar epimerase
MSDPKDSVLVTGTSALVSGATGFLGSRLVPRLLDAGYRVRIMVRNSSRVDAHLQGRVDIVTGDMRDEAALRRAVMGQHLVFHTAGKVTDWGSRKAFFGINTEGTARLLTACREAGVRRLIHVSSLTVLGLPRRGCLVTEETPYAVAPPDPYTASKMAAEQHLLSFRESGQPEIVVIRPGVIWGKGDTTIIPRLAGLLRQKRLPYIGRADNVLGLSHVDNLCSGILLAARAPGAAGQIYHLTDGEEITGREAIVALAETLGLEPPRLSLPFWLLYGSAWLLEAAARLGRRRTPPMLTRYGVRLVACNSRYDIGKARRELGYQPQKTFRSGIRELDLGRETP